jgi:hypothetical protein
VAADFFPLRFLSVRLLLYPLGHLAELFPIRSLQKLAQLFDR